MWCCGIFAIANSRVNKTGREQEFELSGKRKNERSAYNNCSDCLKQSRDKPMAIVL